MCTTNRKTCASDFTIFRISIRVSASRYNFVSYKYVQHERPYDIVQKKKKIKIIFIHEPAVIAVLTSGNLLHENYQNCENVLHSKHLF